MNARRKARSLIVLFMILLFIADIALLVHFKMDSLERIPLIQVAMDFFGMSLGIILFIICLKKWDYASKLGIRFLRLEFMVFIGLVMDAADWILEGHPELRTTSIILETCLYFANPLSAYAFMSYVLEYLGVRELRSSKNLMNLFTVGLSISIVMRLVNLIYPVYFYIDAAGVYHRAFLYQLSNVCTYLGGTITLLTIIYYRKRIKRYQLLILVAFILAPIIALCVNILYYGLTPAFSVMMAVLTSFYLILNVERSREQSIVESELTIATKIQKAMLPDLFPENSDTQEYDLYASMDPAREVGGDFYDFFMLDDNRLAFLVADVSDKGMGAALFMAVSKAMIKMRSQAGGSPAEVLRDVDARLGKDNDLGMFVTVWLGYLDLTTGHVVACNAGHDYPALFLRGKEEGSETGYVVKETVHGPAVAFLPGMKFPEIEFTMKPGDRIFLYTDGVNEAQGADGEEFGFERMLNVLNAHIHDSSESLCRSMKEEVDTFVGDDPQFDDMTMMALTFHGSRAH